MGSIPARYMGIADSGLVMHFDGLAEKLPGMRLAFIWRDVDDCAGSLARELSVSVDQCRDTLIKAERALESLSGRVNAMNISYESLDQPATIRQLWSHLVPTISFPELHFQKVRTMHIELVPGLIRSVAGPTKQLNELSGSTTH